MSGNIAAGIAYLVGTGNPQPTRAQTYPNAKAPRSDDEPQLEAYYNCGTQHIKGLTNQTGYVKGNANGVINFGTLMASAATRRQA